MQRTIRFRGKATGKGNIPTNWVYGGGCFSVAGNTFFFADPTPKFMGNGVYEAKAIEVRFICQSVGLHDIFKAEVYEGDVVRLDGNKKYTYIVEWSKAHSAFLYSEWNTPYREAYVRGFKACMHWLRQNLWHDASDVPEDGTPLLFLFRNSDGYEGYGVLENYANYTWSRTRKGYGVVKWVYISDLLTKGGE